MTGRNYDIIMQFANNISSPPSDYPALTGKFESGNVVIGLVSGASGVIANVDPTANTIKVKLSNNYQEFIATENIRSIYTDSLFQSSRFDYGVANTTSPASNNYPAISNLFENIAEARNLTRISNDSNTFLLPIPANSNSEITAIINNVQIHPSQYIFTNDLSGTQPGTISNSITVGGSTSFDVSLLGANGIFFKTTTPFDPSSNLTLRVDSGNLNATSFATTIAIGNTITANSIGISGITNSPFIAEKNAFVQNPIVRLVTIYYPGEWYPPNRFDNPSLEGEGRAWPNDFPFRIAEINGDIISDISYNVTYGGVSYSPYPLNISAIEQSSDGKINDLTVTIFNFENAIGALVQDPFLAGNNTANACLADVNGELLNGIDPRTINFTPAQVGGSAGNTAFDTLTRARANGLNYSAAVSGAVGGDNSSFTYDTTIDVNGTWLEQKLDSRDLLGGSVEIRSTFASFLDYWPEYSTIRTILGNAYEMVTTMPYRIGDNVRSADGTIEATIEGIEENRFLFLSNPLETDTIPSDALYIINVEADPESFIEDVFNIDSLDALNETTAIFSLVSWLRYFKLVVPKRKFYKNTCQWEYKGEECQYPGPGDGVTGLPIPGTQLLGNPLSVKADNTETANPLDDVCGKSLASCEARNNDLHFGGFPATGRTIPRQ